MVVLIAGDTHTGKTLLAQKLSARYACSCLSIDHLKMGLIRSGRCTLSAESSDAELTDYLWPVVREMVKTCIENSQNIIIEGCYIPFGWEHDFTPVYLEHIRYVCLIFRRDYIEHHFQDILKYEHVVEQRRAADVSIEKMRETNRYNLEQCVARKYRFVLIDGSYRVNPEDMDW